MNYSAFIPVLVPLAGGILVSLLCREGIGQFCLLKKPPFSPPGWVFAPAWLILYTLMGLALWRVRRSDNATEDKRDALYIYRLQLALNLLWPPIFFSLKYYLAALLWLGLLWIAAEICLVRFYRLDRRAGIMLLPYQIWLSFALYLNSGIFVLN